MGSAGGGRLEGAWAGAVARARCGGPVHGRCADAGAEPPLCRRCGCCAPPRARPGRGEGALAPSRNSTDGDARMPTATDSRRRSPPDSPRSSRPPGSSPPTSVPRACAMPMLASTSATRRAASARRVRGGSFSAAWSAHVSTTVIAGMKLSSWGTYDVRRTNEGPRAAPLIVTRPVRRPTVCGARGGRRGGVGGARARGLCAKRTARTAARSGCEARGARPFHAARPGLLRRHSQEPHAKAALKSRARALRAARISSSVLFPAPLGPISAIISCGRASPLTSCARARGGGGAQPPQPPAGRQLLRGKQHAQARGGRQRARAPPGRS